MVGIFHPTVLTQYQRYVLQKRKAMVEETYSPWFADPTTEYPRFERIPGLQ
jgi:hypothetical protein